MKVGGMKMKTMIFSLLILFLILGGCATTRVSNNEREDFCENRGMESNNDKTSPGAFYCRISDIEYAKIITAEAYQKEYKYIPCKNPKGCTTEEIYKRVTDRGDIQ